MKLRVAVAGLGFMGATHIRAWYKVAGAELAAVVSTNPRKLSGDLSDTGGNFETGTTQFDFSHVKKFTQLADALADPDIDAVDLCLPTHLHTQTGLAALRAGKHVLLEKPLARTSAEAYRLLEQAQVSARILMTGHILRFFPEWQELARTLAAAPVKLASFRRNCARPSWSPWLADTTLSGGAPLDLLIHDADFVLHCFGTPDHISAVGLDAPHLGIDWISAQSSFRNGSAATISGGWHPDPNYPFSMDYSGITPTRTLDWSSATAAPSEADPWAAQLQHFTDSARANAVPALSPPAEAAQAVRFAEIMIESRKRNGELIPWSN